MGPEFELLAWRGHRYDVRVLGAAFEYLALRSEAEKARVRGGDGSLAGLFAMEAYEVVLAQDRDVHEVARTHPDGDVCTCGVVAPPGLPLVRATGHLEQRRWQPATAIVVTSAERSFEQEPASATAYCQGCGWTSELLPIASARDDAAAHDCAMDQRNT